jgi:hypothetical protein
VKLRRWRSEACFAREARLRRMKCLPIGKRLGSFLLSQKAFNEIKRWSKPRLQPPFSLFYVDTFAFSMYNYTEKILWRNEK